MACSLDSAALWALNGHTALQKLEARSLELAPFQSVKFPSLQTLVLNSPLHVSQAAYVTAPQLTTLACRDGATENEGPPDCDGVGFTSGDEQETQLLAICFWEGWGVLAQRRPVQQPVHPVEMGRGPQRHHDQPIPRHLA